MELQVVLLTDFQDSFELEPLTNETPKCLLPVGNQPLITFPLQFLEESGFSNVLVVVRKKREMIIREEIGKFLESESRTKMEKVKVVGVDYVKKGFSGDCDILREISPFITKDFVLINCDFVTNFPFQHFLDLYRKEYSDITMLLKKESVQQVNKKGNSSSSTKTQMMKTSKEFVGFEYTEKDYDNEPQTTFFNQSSSYRASYSSEFDDDDVDEDESFGPSSTPSSSAPSSSNSTKKNRKFFKEKKVAYFQIRSLIDEKEKMIQFPNDFLKIRKRFTLRSDLEDMKFYIFRHWILDYLKLNPRIKDIKFELIPFLVKKDIVKVFALMFNTKNRFYLNKLRNIETFKEINRDIKTFFNNQLSGQSTDFIMSQEEKNAKKIQLGNFSCVSQSCQLKGFNLIKRSNLGNDCNVEKKVKIINSVLFENVKVGENTIIKDSIIWSNSVIGKNSKITNAVIDRNTTIKEGSDIADEIISEKDDFSFDDDDIEEEDS